MGIKRDFLHWFCDIEFNFHRSSEAEVTAELKVEDFQCIVGGLDAGERK